MRCKQAWFSLENAALREQGIRVVLFETRVQMINISQQNKFYLTFTAIIMNAILIF